MVGDLVNFAACVLKIYQARLKMTYLSVRFIEKFDHFSFGFYKLLFFVNWFADLCVLNFVSS